MLLDHVQRGTPGHHAVDLAVRRARPQVHARLPAQLRRRVEVAPVVGFDGPDREAPVVHPLGQAVAFERLVDRLRPARAGLLEPFARHQRPRLAGAANFRLGRIVPLEPLRRRPLDAVVHPLADDQVRVRVAAGAPMDRQRVGQPLGRRETPREPRRQGALVAFGKLLRKRELHLPVHSAVRPLVPIGRIPVPPGVVLRPGGHVLALDAGDFALFAGIPTIPTIPLGVLPLARDVVVLRRGRMAARLRSDAHLEMVDGHVGTFSPVPVVV